MLLLCDTTEYSKVSLNTTEVHEMALQRNRDMFGRYTEVLMREKDMTLKTTPEETVEMVD